MSKLTQAKKDIARLKDVKRNKTQETRFRAAIETRKESTDKDTSTSKSGSKGKNFPGTNIPLSTVKNTEKRNDLVARLKQDRAADDIDGMNDVIFSIAYHSVEGGKGQGNPNVSKVHNGAWKVTADVGDNKSWAESAINSENDVYVQKDGSVITYDDSVGAAKDGIASGTWGGQGKGDNQQHSGEKNTHKGKAANAPVNPVISGGGGNSSANYAKLNSIWDQSFVEEAAAGIGDYGKTTKKTGTDTKTGTDDASTRITRATGGTGLGGLMLGSDYRRSAPLDWSSIMPQLAPLQSQQAIQSGEGKFYQPWATRQATPTSLLNYQKPTGGIPPITYQPPGSPVTSTYTGGSGTTDSGTTDSGTTDSGTTDSGATSGVFYGQPYANMAQYHALLARHNQAMQLIRGGHTQMGIGALMGNPGEIARLYALQPDKSDLAVGGESASLSDILTGRNRNTAAATVTPPLSAATLADRAAAMDAHLGGISAINTSTLVPQPEGHLADTGKNIFLQGWGGRQGETGLLDPNAVTATNLGGLFDY